MNFNTFLKLQVPEYGPIVVMDLVPLLFPLTITSVTATLRLIIKQYALMQIWYLFLTEPRMALFWTPHLEGGSYNYFLIGPDMLPVLLNRANDITVKIWLGEAIS